MPDTTDGDPRKDTSGDGPSLELPSLGLPSLGWGRKRRRAEPDHPAEPGHPVEDDQPTTSTAPTERVEAITPATVPLTAVSAPEPALEPEPAAEPEPRVRAERGPGGMAAAVLTGLVVGLGIVGLTWASLRLCESVQGTSSCGDAGYGLLIGILAGMIVVGALLLRLARVPEPGSTSFLAVGLTAVLALVFLVDSLLDRPMVVVIPLITAGTFALAHWVTRTFAGPTGG
ncbi:MAG TPA: hypothetical protein VD864_17925 [Nocardioides sp.]|nr:hypothetical protein [Nocardioides sp.]